jgi:hypothetical protein
MVVAVAYGCKKEKAEPAEESVSLRDKPVAEAKGFVQGHWKIHYIYGGLTGNMKTVIPHHYLDLLPNDSIYLRVNNQLFAADKAGFVCEGTIFGYTAVQMRFKSLSGIDHAWVIERQKDDTLVLVNNATEPDSYFMTKVE